MGMFNTIKDGQISEKCPKCKRGMGEWQTKEMYIKGYALDNLLSVIDLNDGVSGEAHNYCDECKVMWEVEIVDGEVKKIFNETLSQTKGGKE